MTGEDAHRNHIREKDRMIKKHYSEPPAATAIGAIGPKALLAS
jgi:hypothetical protein